MTKEQIRKFLPKEEWLGLICYCAATLWIGYVGYCLESLW